MEKNGQGADTLQLVLDNMQSIVYVADVDSYEIIFANKTLKSIIPTKVEGKKCWEVLTSFPGPCPYCKVEELKKCKIGEPQIWENFQPDLQEWFQLNDSIVMWPDSRQVHLVVATSIDKIKKNEETLKQYKEELEVILSEKTENEQMLKALSDNLPKSFVFQLMEKEGESTVSIVYISKGVENICGISAEQLGGDMRPILALFHPEDLEKLMTFAKEGKAFALEARLKVPGVEEVVWLNFSEIPRVNQNGDILWDGIAIDITARKKMQEELAKSQEELLHNATLMKEISDNMARCAVYRTHLDKNNLIQLDYASKQIEEITGVELNELEKDLKKLFKNIHPDDLTSTMERIISTTATLDHEWTECRYIKNGEVLWIRLQSKGSMQNGQLYRDGIIMDITEQKDLEAQLIKARDKAEESDKLKSTFLANMSHEIRTPMNAIIGFLEFMSTDDDIPRDTQKEYMRIVSDNANQLLTLIGDILDISKIDAGQMKIIPEMSNLNTLLLDIRASFLATGAIANKEIDLIVNEIGQDSDGVFTFDNSRLRQVLNNIIGNAIKFTDRGYVKFGYKVAPAGLHFYVEDTGIGISRSKLEDLGKPFHQLHDAAHAAKYGGTGIGLAISINLVKLMGGTFSVKSEMGHGSLFEFTIPCKEIDGNRETILEMVTESEVANIEAEIASNDLKGYTILIAEDIDANLGYLRTLLRNSNAKLLVAANGIEAVEIVGHHPEINLVLMDVRMPSMDGLVATKQIKNIRPDLPVIGQTAYVSEEDQERMKQAGFDDFVPKPVKRSLLQEKIRHYLRDIF